MLNLEDLKTGNIENANEGRSLARGLVKRLVDAGDDPLEELLVERL